MLRPPVRSRGVTCVDILAAVLLMLLLAAVCGGALFASRERANRVKCASNLRQIGTALMLYANDAKSYPRVAYDRKEGAKLNYFTGVRAANPFAKDGPQANDVAAVFFLLVRNEDLSVEAFVCPSVQRDRTMKQRQAFWKKQDMQKMSNFPELDDLDYSITQPYPDETAIRVGYKWSPNVSADWAIAGDLNPGGKEMLTLTGNMLKDQITAGNSRNHKREGQNVLYNDGHVDWSATPFAGANRDNVYTRAKVRAGAKDELVQLEPPASEEGVQPACDLDSVFVPTAQDGPTTQPSR